MRIACVDKGDKKRPVVGSLLNGSRESISR